MKKLLSIFLILSGLCVSLSSCDKDEPMLVDYATLYLDYFKSVDNQINIEYSRLQSKISQWPDGYIVHVPQEGGKYSFVFDENAYTLCTGNNKKEPVKYFDFLLSEAALGEDSTGADRIENYYQKLTSLPCFFMQYESYPGGFTITVEPNPSQESRTVLLQWSGYPVIAELEITQLGKQQ
ncbi:MAG: hypothetical protein NC217_05355 [Muribaculaceae bacterium]|nr:hypothetical protein [Muribaculaceae bacterium]